jgi:hypothetical protein
MSKSMPRLVAFVAAWVLAASTALAQTGQVSLARGPDISADHMSTSSNGWFRASGNVFIIYADHQLRADYVELNRETGEVHARGNIDLFRGEQGRWSGQTLNYNYLTKEGLTGASEVHASKFTAMAERTVADSNNVKRLYHARVTTCSVTNPASWHYWLSASEIDFREQDRVTLYNAVPYFLGVPFFYVPYATRDLNHPFGPRIVPGYRSDWGPFVLTTYTYPIYTGAGDNDLVGSMLLDYRGDRGLAYGHQFDWSQEDLGKGLFGFYQTRDRNPDDINAPTPVPVDPNRYRVYFHHEANPTPVDQILVNGDILSDPRMIEDFFPALYREQSQPDNFAAYTHRGLTYAAGLGANGPLNNCFTGVGHVPEGWLYVFPQELFEDSGLYYESQSSAGYLVQQWADQGWFTNRIYEPDTVRLHTHQKLTYPMHAFDDVVSIVPRAAYDYTFYSRLTDSRTNEVRSLFEFGTEVSAKWFANYPGGYRHIFEPYLDYAIVTSPINVKPGENFFFDRVDGPREWGDQFGLDGNYPARRWHGVRPGMRNTVQAKEADGSTRTVFDWDVFLAYRFGNGSDNVNTNNGSGLRAAGWDLTWRPERDIKLRTEGLYDTEGGRLDMSDTSILYGEDRDWTFELGYFTSDPVDPNTLNWPINPGLLGYDQLRGYNALRPTELVRFAVTHRFNPYWSANLFTRYNTRDSRLDEVGGYLQYELDCLAFRLSSGYVPAFTRYDGSHRAADYRVAFFVWVKALQSDYIEKMRGW